MKLGTIANFAFGASKHCLASLVIVGGFTALCTLVYFAGMVVGIVFFGDMGGPLNIVLVPLLSFALSFVATAFFLFPSTALAERLCGRASLGATFAQIPASCALLFGELCIVACFIGLSGGEPFRVAGIIGAALVMFALLAIPLGAYWWILKSADGVRAALAWTWRMARRKMA